MKRYRAIALTLRTANLKGISVDKRVYELLNGAPAEQIEPCVDACGSTALIFRVKIANHDPFLVSAYTDLFQELTVIVGGELRNQEESLKFQAALCSFLMEEV